MGCNCKGGKLQVLNNLDSQDHIEFAREIYERVVVPNETGEYSDLDKIEIVSAYSTLYPNSKTISTIDESIEQIRIGIDLYDNKNRKKYKR
jgi:hypothetical protein